MRRKLRIEMHEEYGSLGLKPLWMPGHQSDPLMGTGVAHDVLEHGPADACEWQGLGGAIYVRANNGYFSRGRGNPDAVENIASDFNELFNLWEGQPIPTPRRRPRVQRHEASVMDTINSIVLRGCALVVSERTYDDDVQAIAEAEQWVTAEQRQRMRDWMLLGYRACAHRWRLVDTYMVYETFIAIEDGVDTFLKHNADYEGLEVALTFDVASACVRIDLEDEYPNE